MNPGAAFANGERLSRAGCVATASGMERAMTRQKKWTPGIWGCVSHTVYALNEKGTNRFTAHVERGFGWATDKNRHPTSRDELEANAEVMAAAPDLVEALEGLIPNLDEKEFRRAMEHAQCHAGVCRIDKCARCGRHLKAIRALAKAYGESSDE